MSLAIKEHTHVYAYKIYKAPVETHRRTCIVTRSVANQIVSSLRACDVVPTSSEVVTAPDMEKTNVVSGAGPKIVATQNSSETASEGRDTLAPLEYRKLIWKLDVHLLPPLFVLWFVSLIDRLNIGSAKIFGIEKDLHMDPRGTDFNVAIITTMVGLIFFDVPSNYLLKRTRPSWVLTAENLLLGAYCLPHANIYLFDARCWIPNY